MRKRLLILILFISVISFAQKKSVIQEQSEYYKSLNMSDADFYKQNKQEIAVKEKSVKSCNLNKMVFGWHPYWVNGLEANYDWNLISDFCYFSYEVNASNGEAVSTHSWETTSSVTEALNNGVNVHLCVTLFSDHATFLGNSTSRQTLIDNLITLIGDRNAKGVNIDFEGVPSSQSANLTSFMQDLSTQMHSQIPGSVVSIDLYAVDWSGVYDIAAMEPYVDLFMVMGYDYYWTNSTTAGPNSPLYTFESSYNYNLSKTITYYTHQGVPSNKLVMGIPYYGRDWPTDNSTIPSNTSGSGSSKLYKTIRANADGYYSNRLWEPNTFNSYYVYNNGNWHQCFSDDEYTLPYKYDLFNRRDLAGIGIWALSYDDGYNELWDLLNDYFTDCATTLCSDTIYDMGGPAMNYYDNEDYTYTIAPTGAVGLSLNFTEFSLEDNYDSLWIYDGNSTSANLIGGYSGTNSPGLINATGNSLTLKFNSDGATTESGFKAIWTCSIDNILPTTDITANDWETQDFSVSFTDADDNAVNEKFYHVAYFDGNQWLGNTNNGFLHDNFPVGINTQWIQLGSTWTNISEALNQADEVNANTNIYANVSQTSGNIYLYKWRMKISGTGTNRRAGIYFMCDDATQTQRNNSYMVYFRVDQDKCQIYKAESNVIDVKTDDDCIVNADEWFDAKIIYNSNTGSIKVYKNDTLVSLWTDGTPITTGNSISLRTGEANVSYDDFAIYRSRTDNETITVGANADAQFQNPDLATPACLIESIVTDVAGNFSIIDSKYINIDWTNPENISFANDGLSSDIDTIYDYTMNGNWDISTDVNSDIKEYWYAIGTSAGNNDILDWTSTSTNTDFTNLALSLSPNIVYYVNVKAENNAGLFSDIISTDGVLILDTILNINTIKSIISVYPNPAKDYLHISSSKIIKQIKVIDINGKTIKQIDTNNSDNIKMCFSLML